jgi:dTMP kinase
VFVTFEGIGGAGKTTQTDLLAVQLRRRARTFVATREPGGTPLGERLRDVLLAEEDDVAPWAEAALFAAARAQLVARIIRPVLASGADVICDRYVDSSLAYQGIARGLGVERVLKLNLPLIHGLLPDVTFLLLLDVEEAHRRRTKSDRIERRDLEFLRKVDSAYRELATLFPDRIVPLDAMKQPSEIGLDVIDELRQHS